ncbi:hypothetical protein Aduo_001427 [Ancylostoma duodenale]
MTEPVTPLVSHVIQTVLGHAMEGISSMEVLTKMLEKRLNAEIAEKNKLKGEIEVLKNALAKSRVTSASLPVASDIVITPVSSNQSVPSKNR